LLFMDSVTHRTRDAVAEYRRLHWQVGRWTVRLVDHAQLDTDMQPFEANRDRLMNAVDV
jgi:hypothetical protein